MTVSNYYYWTLVGLTQFGSYKRQDIPAAQAFFRQHFIDDPLNIQKQWVAGGQEISHVDQFHRLSMLCLRCFISNIIYTVCQTKVTKFGQRHHFEIEDILPLVLDELPRSNSDDLYDIPNTETSLTMQILQTFNPEQSNLSTWTSWRVRSHKALKRFLLEQGLEEVSDWVLLNERKPSGLHRILKEFFDQTEFEVKTGVELLQAYHDQYRDPIREIRRQRQSGKRQRYPQPTTQQLAEIAHQVEGTILSTPEEVLEKLQALATLIREYRSKLSRQRTGRPSRDPPKRPSKANERVQDDLSESLQPYIQSCLESALQSVIEFRFRFYDQQDSLRADHYLKALDLFHCQGLSMGEIAQQLGWKSQSKVSRFLELSDLRADVRRQTLVLLKKRLARLKDCSRSPDELKALDQRLSDLLEPRLEDIIKEAVREASTSKNRRMNSQFSKTLCQVLKTRKEER